MTLTEFEFELERPGPPLAPYLESVWWARGRIPYRQERIAPTGSTVAVVVLGSPIVQVPRNGEGERFVATEGWPAGPHDGPVLNAPTAETWAVGVVSSPVGCRALFGVDPAPLRGRVVNLESARPAAVGLRRSLLGVDGPAAALALAAVLRAGLRPDLPGVHRCAAAVAALEADPVRPIAEIAEEVGVSHAHLDREFQRVVGLTPRSLARILRLRCVLEAVDVHAGLHWAALAAEWGWFDQSHFIRDFRRHTGVTPSGYAVEPERSVTLDSVQGGVTARYVYRLDPAGDRTAAQLSADVAAAGPWALLGPVIRAAIRRTDSGQLEALRGVVERAPA